MRLAMRNAFVIAVIFATLAAAAETKWRQVSSFKIDWDKYPDVEIRLSIPVGWGDPGDFTRITVRVPGHKVVAFTNNEGWVKYLSPDASTSQQIKNSKNVISSDYVFGARAGSGRTALFLFGYSYASSPGRLDALEISPDGDVRRVLHGEELGLKEFRDLDGDGIAEIVGYPCLSQEWGNGLLTYDPFNIFKLSNVPAGAASLSVPLSKAYNLKHYYGWAGPKCSEDLAVVLHPPKGGKPVILPAKEAARITENAPKP